MLDKNHNFTSENYHFFRREKLLYIAQVFFFGKDGMFPSVFRKISPHPKL